jgi:hypothetical protein
MRQLLMALVLAALAAPATAQPGGYFDHYAQRDSQKGRQASRDERPRQFQQERRPERDDRRQGAMSEEDRRSLHRDLDKANRELYRRRGP